MVKKRILAMFLAFSLVFASGCSKQESDVNHIHETEVETEIVEVEKEPETKPVVTDAVVTSQFELDLALVNKHYESITLAVDGYDYIAVTEGNYDVDFIVNAPEASVDNYASFRSVTIDGIAENTWNEYNSNNVLTVTAPTNSHLTNPADYMMQTTVESNNTNVTIDVYGTLEKLNINGSSSVLVKVGDNGIVEPIYINAPNSELTINSRNSNMIQIYVAADAIDSIITSNAPVSISTEAPITVTLERGAEGTVIESSVGIKVDVTNNTTKSILLNGENVEPTLVVAKPLGDDDETSSDATTTKRPSTDKGNIDNSGSNSSATTKPNNNNNNNNNNSGTGGSGSTVTPTNPHKHNYVTLVSDTATCTKDGVKTYRCACDATEERTSPKTGHKYKVSGSSVSKTSDGFQAHSVKCENCGDTSTEKCTFSSAKKCTICGSGCSHYKSAATKKDDSTHNVTCISCGNTTSGSHTYSLASATEVNHVMQCSECYGQKTEVHSYSNGNCSGCGYSCGHSYIPFQSCGAYEHAGPCDYCGMTVTRSHEFEAETGTCLTCMHLCTHPGEITIITPGAMPWVRCEICKHEYTQF